MRLEINVSDMNAKWKREQQIQAAKHGLSLKLYLSRLVEDNLHLILGEGWDDD